MKRVDFLGWLAHMGFAKRLGRLRALALAAVAAAGFLACSDTATRPTDAVATTASALSGNADPMVRHSFDEISGTVAKDSSGNGHAAMLQNGAIFVAGARGNAVRIAGGSQRVALPQGVVERCENLTIAVRVNLASNSANWARIFDIGSGPGVNMFLTPRAGAANVLRFAITTGGASAEQQVSYAYNFPVGTWKHLAVVLAGNTATMYLDGQQIAQNTNFSLKPWALGLTTQNWLGDSQYAADPTLDGSIDDFFVSCREYNASEVAFLASGSDPAGQWLFDETTGTTAFDSSGNVRHATLASGASFVAGLSGNAVQIAGGSQRVNLPTGIVQSCTDLTVAAHVRLTTNASNWARIFDFGSSTSKYLMLTPRAGASNILRFAITTAGNGAEQRLSYTYNFPAATWKHVAVVLQGTTGTMYVDGTQVSQGTITLDPNALGSTVNNWLGDSQFAADPTLNGTIDNLLVSCRPYSPAEIGALAGTCASNNCDDGRPCTTDTCNAGFCSHGTAPNGTSCADGSLCNGGESCQSGSCVAGTPPVVDDGNACTTDTCDPMEGVTHTPIPGCGGGGAGGGGGSGGASGGGGTSGSAGTGGGGGAGCPSGTTSVEMAIELPPDTPRAQIAIGSYGATPLELNDRVRVLAPGGTTFASASSLSASPTIPTRLGVESHVQNLFGEPSIELRDRSRVHGNAVSPGSVTLFPQAVVDGQTIQQPLTPRRRESWLLCHPNTHQGHIDLQPGQVFPSGGMRLPPGAWGTLAVKTSARIRLRGNATYFFESIAIEPGGILDLDTAAGGIQLYFRNGGFFRGVQERTDTRPNVLFGMENGSFTINGSFRGTVVAPRGLVELPTAAGGHQGSFYGAPVIVRPDANVTHEAVDTTGMCDPNSGTGNGLCPADGGETCVSDADCKTELVCWLEGGRHFDKPGGTGVCAPPVCRTDPILGGCGDLSQPCGRCEGTPRPCTTNADCIPQEVCGTDNGVAFGMPAGGDFCWPPDCNIPATTPARCGAFDSACGICDCSANCAGRTCGDSTDDECGGQCAGLCGDGEPGCTSSLDCPEGSVCGMGIGPRFGHPEGTNACWPADCADQDPALPNGGVDPARCGVSPACAPECEVGSTGPDGCGGFCGECSAGEVRHEDGACGAPVAFIDRSGVDLPIGLDVMDTNEVGASPGSFSVTDRGHASYSMAIQVPPGRLGMQPNLALRYLSTKADGMLGIGWSLSGLSTITRCRRFLDGDGVNAPVTLGPGDRFCLDGQALVKIGAGTYGDDGVEYRTEIDSFSKVVSRGSQLDSSGRYKGPAWFEVFTKDGRILSFGRRGLSSVKTGEGPIRVWAVDRIQDRSGNAIDIEYKYNYNVRASFLGGQTERLDTGELLPQSIAYGGNRDSGTSGLPGSGHTRFVKFAYDRRPDPTHHYVAGVQGYSVRRVERIDTFVGSKLVKSYELTYQTRDASNLAPSQLESVRECGVSATGARRCLKPTTFEYFEEVPFGEERDVPTSTGCPQSFGCAAPPIVVLDQNGDGLDDLLTLDPYSLHGFLARPVPGSVSNGLPFEGTLLPSFTEILRDGERFRPCLGQDSVIDLDRDGRDDLVDLCLPWAYLSNAAGELVPTPIHVPDTGTDRKRFADFDGDGLRDLFSCRGDNAGRIGTIIVSMNSGSDFFEPIGVEVVDSSVNTSCEDLLVMDHDGDGEDSIILTRSSVTIATPNGNFVGDGGMWSLSRWRLAPMGRLESEWLSLASTSLPPKHTYVMLDFNGDGLKDFLGQRGQYWVNTGKGFAVQRLKLQHSFPGSAALAGSFQNATVMDRDGDGREDLIIAPAWFRLAQPGLIDGGNDLGFGDVNRLGEIRPILVDVDGDGSQELAHVPPSGIGLKLVKSAGSGRSRLLHQVTDGVGWRTTIEYDGLYDPPIDARYPLPPETRQWVRTLRPSSATCQPTLTTRCQNKVGPLVSTSTRSQVWNLASGEFAESEPPLLYQYFGPTMALRGRGSLGFTQRRVEHPLSRTETTFHTDDFRLAGRPRVIETTPVSAMPSPLGNEERFEQTELSWGIFQSGAGRPYPYLFRQVTTLFNDLLEPGVIRSTELVRAVPDEFGNETGRTVPTSSSEGVVDVTAVATAPIINDPESWIIGLPAARVITSTRGDSRYRFIDYQYDLERRLLTGVVRNGGPLGASDPAQHRETLFFPDAFGNVNGTCVNDSSGSQRCSGVLERDDQNIFPERIRDAEFMTSEYIFAVEDGQLLATIDPNGILSERGFDAFGRPQQVKTPTAEGKITYSEQTRTTNIFQSFFVRGAIGVTSSFAGEGERTSIFDAYGRLVQTQAPGFDGAVIHTDREYDRLGRLVLATVPHDPANASEGLVAYTYDGVGRLSKIMQPDGHFTEYFYTNVLAADGDYSSLFGPDDSTLSLVKLPRGNVRLTVLDAAGLTSSTREASNIDLVNMTRTDFERGAFGTVRQVFAPQGSTTYDIDDWGRTRSVTDPALGNRSFVYNGFDELVSETDARGQVDQYRYDNLGRLVEKLDVDGDVIAHWDFDGDPDANEQGRLVGSWRRSAPDSDEGTWLLNEYEAPNGLPSASVYHIGAALDDRAGGEVFATEYEYEEEDGIENAVPGRLSKITYPSNGGNFRIRYRYDSEKIDDTWVGSGAIRTVFPIDDQDAEGTAFWTLTDADEGYRLGTEEFGNGVTSTRTYYDATDCLGDPNHSCAGRLRDITTTVPGQAPFAVASHTWDLNGNLASLGDGGSTLNFQYDSLDRLRREFVTAGPQNDITIRSYTYDDLGAGDLTFKTGIGAYAYETRPSGNGAELRTAGDTTYWYDDNGNQTERIGPLAERGYQRLDYNDFDMPERIVNGDLTDIARTTTELEYTASGQRVVERRSSPGFTTERIHAGDLYERTRRIPLLSTEHRYKVLVGSRQVAEVVRNGSNDTDPDVFYLHDDHLGSVTAITDPGGGVVEARRYEPFGGMTTEGNATGVRSSFTGHDADTGIGLVNARGRLYDAKIGRFISADPFVTNPRSSQGWNRYAYVENNPLAFTDPSGFQNCEAACSDSAPDSQRQCDIHCRGVPPSDRTHEGDRSASERAADEAQRNAERNAAGGGTGYGQPALAPYNPAGITQTPEGQLIEQILADAMAGSDCDPSIASCGPTPLDRELSSLTISSNMLNRAASLTVEEAKRAATKAYDVPPESVLSPVDFIPTNFLAGVAIGAGKAVGASTVRALVAADIGLTGRGIAALEGSVINAGTTRIINVVNIKAAAPGTLTSELRGAIPSILNAGRAEGVRTLQITGTFANPGLAQFAASQAARHGGTYSSVGGVETLTFILP